MAKLRPGDRVTFRKGKTYGTTVPGWTPRSEADLNGCRAVVVEKGTQHRESEVDGRVRERVTVAPIEGEHRGELLDVPVDNLRSHTFSGFMREVKRGAAEATRKVFGGYSEAGRNSPLWDEPKTVA